MKIDLIGLAVEILIAGMVMALGLPIVIDMFKAAFAA